MSAPRTLPWTARMAAVLLLAAAVVGCGKKGPPLAPLRLVPNTVTDLRGVRSGDRVSLKFTLPTANLNGPGPIELDHVEVYAVTVAPGAVTPPNRELLTKKYAVGQIPVKPPPVENTSQEKNGEAAAPDSEAAQPTAPPPPPDLRPGPGDPASFVETLTDAERTPADLPLAATTTPAAPEVPAVAGPIAGTAPSPPPPIQPGDAVPPPSPSGPPVSQIAAAEQAAERPAEAPATEAPAEGAAPQPATAATGEPPAAAAPGAQAPVEPAAPAGAPPGGQPAAGAAQPPAGAAPAAEGQAPAAEGQSPVGPGAPAPGAPAAQPGAPATGTAAAGPPPATYPVRVYIMRGVTKSGRPGQPSPRVTVPLVDPPPAPASPVPDFTEKSVTLTWTAVAPAEAAGPPVVYNVYRANAEGAPPLNPTPLAEPHFETADISIGREDCFVLRSAQVYQNVPVESAESPAACVTPVDKFPPAAPSGLNALFPQGAVELVWEANAESDLAGYLILRGSAPGDTLQTLTPAPVSGTTYRDATVTPGAHYVYAVVAVDRAGNRSAPSAQVEGTAR